MASALEVELQRHIERILSQLLIAPVPGVIYSEPDPLIRSEQRLDIRRAVQLHPLQSQIRRLEPRHSAILGPASPGSPQYPQVGYPLALNLAAGVRAL